MATDQRRQEQRTRRWRNARTVAAGILAGIVLLVAALGIVIWWQVAGTWHPTPVTSISPSTAELEYELWFGCYQSGDVRSSVSERDDAILVTVEISGELADGLMCGSYVRVTLDEPLGDRQVFDSTTRGTVPVR